MKKLFFLLIFSISLSAQIDINNSVEAEDEMILRTIVYDRITRENDSFILKCEKTVVPFDPEFFLEHITLITVPYEILLELRDNSKKQDKEEKWTSISLRKLGLIEDFSKYSQCITTREIEALFDENKSNVFNISKPIYDSSKKHCVVHLSNTKFPGSISGCSLFLKKIYGKWVIVTDYGCWLS